MRLYPVLYIPNLTTRILSLGEFLLQGLHVVGDRRHITLWRSIGTQETKVMICAPLIPKSPLFYLAATIENAQSISSIHLVDYNIMHRRLGHPSKDVMSNAQKHTKGFPKISIPSDLLVCPGCVQGKMPASAHPPSETRATAAF